MFSGYLRVRDRCGTCGEALNHHRADDAPAYLTMVAVGILIVPVVWFAEARFRPPVLMHIVVWPLLGVVLSVLLLPRIKGAVVALQWVLGMHGFEAQRNRESPEAGRRE